MTIVHKKHFTVFTVYLLISTCFAWENLPPIPTGRRTQFLLLEGDGSYRYGYDTGIDSAAKQGGDASNQVEGHYFYTAPTGQKIDLKYTAGVQGFVPEGLDTLQNSLGADPISAAPAIPLLPNIGNRASSDDLANTGDASYSFNYDAGDSRRQESSDASGNVQGSYSYSNSAGSHDLSYIAGSRTGFVATGGSLSVPNGLGQTGPGSQAIPLPIARNSGGASATGVDVQSTGPNSDGSYSFSYNAGDSTRQESGDASGNVQGSYSFRNEAGNNDLSYIAGAGTGFVATGGSLATPNGIGQTGPGAATIPLQPASITPNSAGASAQGVDIQSSGPNSDGSYSFVYNAGDSTRQESGDASGNVQGSYSFRNDAGNNDLTYIAGAATGFVATGGSLATPNGLGQDGPGAASIPLPVIPITPNIASRPASGVEGQSTGPNSDGSYSFSYNAGDSTRQESEDASGNVQGSYSFRNEAGNNDLTYIAGASTGFVATGGSLATPNGLGDSGPSGAVPAATPNAAGAPEAGDDGDDGSYKPSIAESDDSGDDGSYKPSTIDSSGTDGDGTYTPSGTETGDSGDDGSYRPSTVDSGATGEDGSYTPSGDESGDTGDDGSYTQSADEDGQTSIDAQERTGSQANSGDASYSFTIDTDDIKRQESSDASGNVQGSFSYRNAAGTHDLQFVAGSETGFLPTGGSLAVSPALTDAQLAAGEAAARAAAGASSSTGSGAALPSAIPISPIVPSTNSLDGSEDDQANTGDATYSFTIDTDDYKRQESSDASGNVQGSYSFKNAIGTHDLQFVAGSETGFLPTGGSLSVPPGLTEEQLNQGAAVARAGANVGSSVSAIPRLPALPSGNSEDDQANTGDASYSFNINTDTYQRSESSDASGNVQGRYAYQNSAGNHDLSFVAGSATGFQPTGGSLSIPSGLTEAQLRVGAAVSNTGAVSDTRTYLPPQAPASRIPFVPVAIPYASTVPVTSYSIGSASVKTYLPPNNRQKFGYIYDTQ